MIQLEHSLKAPGRMLVGGVPDGADALLIARYLAGDASRSLLHVARDDARMARMAAVVRYHAPDVRVLEFPAWDCLPYDRVGPNAQIVARRLEGLTALANGFVGGLVVTTVNALAQRVPPPSALADASFTAEVGDTLDREALTAFLERNGYHHTSTVREPGEYAVRGGIIDVFPTGAERPCRVDLFGDDIETIRAFDPVDQRSTGQDVALVIKPVSEVALSEDNIRSFRSGYRALFGTNVSTDPLYEAVSAGRRIAGMEHWLPLFYERLAALPDYLPGTPVTLDAQAAEVRDARLETIADTYQTRATGSALAEGATPYRPLPPERLYLGSDEWDAALADRPVVQFSPFDAPPGDKQGRSAGVEGPLSFAEARADRQAALFDAAVAAIAAEQAAGRRAVVTGFTTGSRDRLMALLGEHGLGTALAVESWAEAMKAPKGVVVLPVLPLETGYRTRDLAVITEQDILGERMARAPRRQRKADNIIAEANSLAEGDLVVHREHGIGRYDGLIAIEVAGAPHDCLRVLYADDDKLFLPVENIEVLSRFGPGTDGVVLDRLGGVAWQARKAKVKKRIREIADQLIRIAAERVVRTGETVEAPDGVYDEFAARFPYPETDDQLRAIEQTITDLASGKPMDRLICGDVGFGKTEVALRAAFIAAMSGGQVAVVVPTTLLCRQHFATFKERFQGLPVRIEQLSRLVTQKDATATRKALAEGQVDIVVGTHALLSKSIKFKHLSLLIVDEEQHFGVAQKERLKQLKSNVHVLTLTATPIPRTLQLALSGVRDMSMIATPPVDRLAVRTFVLPFDPVVIREALLREHYRGGQTFYVCPRVSDLARVEERIAELVPEVKMRVAHGQMAPSALEEVMTAFYDRQFDVLLSTQIVESGLDLPAANTIIIHRADMFGLAQLYQLRGRVGRGKVRAYAYLTVSPGKVLTGGAQQRLQVMQTLDTLGAGFTLASHDLDIRGAGNLLGEEQSGQIKEVGVELYQQLLEEAVAAARSEGDLDEAETAWSPQITIGVPVLIPDDYVADLGLRLSLYRRAADLDSAQAVEGFAAELIDRFGPLPSEVENLLEIVQIKALCRTVGVEKLDAGPKGAVLAFHNDQFANPAGLVEFIATQVGRVKLRPDHRLVYRRDWTKVADRLRGARDMLRQLERVVEESA